MNFTATAGFIWSVADLLRGDYRQSDYGKVILPFTLLRRLDCVLEGTKADVLEEYGKRKDLSLPLEQFLTRKAKQNFYNTSPLDFRKLLADPANIKANLQSYINAFSPNARDIFERYQFFDEIEDKGFILAWIGAVEPRERLHRRHPGEFLVHVHGHQQRLVEVGLELVGHQQNPVLIAGKGPTTKGGGRK